MKSGWNTSVTSARGLAHRLRVGAEDLHADRPLVGTEAQLVQRGLVLAADPLGGEELGDHDVRAELPAEPPERRLRHPGHGAREYSGMSWSTANGKRIFGS